MGNELHGGGATEAMPEELQQTLGDRMRKSMEYAGLTIPDMALWLGVHRNSVSSYVNDRTHPGIPVIRLWAMRCNVPFSWIQTGSWPEPEPAVKRPAKRPAKKVAAKVAAKRTPRAAAR